MKNKLSYFLLATLFLISVDTVKSQEYYVKSNLENLEIEVGEVFEPSTYAVDENGKITACPNLVYYNKNGALNRDDGISVSRRSGTIRGEEPGNHKVVALCLGLTDGWLGRDFDVKVSYAQAKDLIVKLNSDQVFVGSYVQPSYVITDNYGFTRYDANIKVEPSNDNIQIDALNNIKAIKPGKVTLTFSLDNVEATINLNVVKNPINNLVLSSDLNTARTGDVVTFSTMAYDDKNRIISDLPIVYSYSGESFDKSNTAAAMIRDDGKFVAETAGKYLITATAGQRSTSIPLVVYDRGIQREVINVGTGIVQERHTSDFWVFEGVDNRDYAVSGTWGADGTTYFWDVTDPGQIRKIDSIKVDARTVNDVKVSEDGKISVISREGASNRKNGIVIIDTTNPYDVNIISEYTTNLTGGVHNVFIYENHVYALSNGERFYVINIEDPSNPYEVGMFEIGEKGQAIHDVWVEDGIAYTSNWKHGVYIIDVGNGVAGGSPSNPVVMSNYSYESGAHHATFPFKSKSTGKFYTILGDEIFPQGIDLYSTNETAGFLHFVDFTDIDNPVEVARYELPGHGSHNYWIEDDILYVAMYTGGVRIVDISGELMGDLFRQGREIGHINTGNANGFIPNATMTWGAQLYKGHVFYSDHNGGIGSSKVLPIKPDNSRINEYLDRPRLID